MGRVLLEEGVVSERWPHFLIDTVAMEICIFCKLTSGNRKCGSGLCVGGCESRVHCRGAASFQELIFQ